MPRPALSLAALVVLAGALGGCTGEEPTGAALAPDQDREARTARSGEADHANMTKRSLAQVGDGSHRGPGRIPITVEVPPGGAVDVTWTATAGGTAGPTGDRLEGPGCTVSGWSTGFVASEFYGGCDDLPAGPVQFELVLEGAVTGYNVVVEGWLPL